MRTPGPYVRAGIALFASVAVGGTLVGCGSGAGTGATGAQATLSAASLTFSAISVGSSAPAQNATLTNSGGANLAITSIALTGANPAAFTLANNCGASLAPGGSCTITATYTSPSTGTFNANIAITDNAANSPQAIALIGSTGFPSQCKSTVTRRSGPTPTSNFSGTTFTGKVRAGNLPVIGASVQIYAAGASGNGSAATPLLPAALTTDANGAFSVTTSYTCPYNLSLVYAVARGGKPGPAGAPNSALVLMSALGACNSLAGNPSFVVNELTTVASAYALAQFYSDGGNIGASSTNFNGLQLGAATAANLVNISTGAAPGANFPAFATLPLANLNALANALNACAVSASACTQLFSATAGSGSSPVDTLDAIFNVARHPGANIAALYTVTTASSAYTPALASAPSDWTLFVTYAGAGMNGPAGIGIDSLGNVSVASYFFTASLFTNTGTPIVPNGISGNNLNNSYGLGVDSSDNSWIPNEQSPHAINGGLGSVTVLSNAGQPLATYAQGGFNYPVAVAFDPSGTAWVVDYGNSHLTLLNPSGVPISGAAGYTSSQFAFPVAVAVDSKCYGYVANQSSNTITRVAQDGSLFNSFITGGGASGVAVDAQDNVWVANYYDNSVGLLLANGTIRSNGFGGGGINHPQGIAVDGANNIWLANYRGSLPSGYSSLTELAGASASTPGAILSPATPYGLGAGMVETFAIAIDSEGNIWVTNFGSNTLTEFVGLAAPVRTPMLGPVALP